MLQCAPLLRIVYLYVEQWRQRRQSTVSGLSRLRPLPSERQHQEPPTPEASAVSGGRVWVEGATEAVQRTPSQQTPAPPGGGRRIASGDGRRRRDDFPCPETAGRGDDGQPEPTARATPLRHQRAPPAAGSRETGADARSARSLASSQHRVDQSEPAAYKHGGRLEAVSTLHSDDGERDGEYAVSATVRRTASHWQRAASPHDRDRCIADFASPAAQRHLASQTYICLVEDVTYRACPVTCVSGDGSQFYFGVHGTRLKCG